MASIAERIVTYRTINNLTQKEFASRCGLSLSTIAHIETNPAWPVGKMAKRKIEYVLLGGRVKDRKEDI